MDLNKLDPHRWKVEIVSCKQQDNGYDCGVLTLMNALWCAYGSFEEYESLTNGRDKSEDL